MKGRNAEIYRNNASLPVPEISSHVLVGLASITRLLERIAGDSTRDRPLRMSDTGFQTAGYESEVVSEHDSKATFPHIAAIFVCRSSQPSVLHAHLPQLVATASSKIPHLQPTRLVQLPHGSGNRLSSSLGLSRASFVAILENAPHSKSLVELIQNTVSVIKIPWLDEVAKAQYRPVKINSILTTIPA